MRVIIGNIEYYFENRKQAVSQVMEQIQRETANSGMLFSHMLVDGVEVYQDPEQYLAQHVQGINNVTVHLVSVQSFCLDVIHTAKEYVSRAIPQVERLSEEFYASVNEESWEKLGQLVEALDWFQQTERFLNQVPTLPDWAEGVRNDFQFSEVLVQLSEAVEQQDVTLIGDILQFEILTRFANLHQTLENHLNEEGKKHDVN